MELIWNKKELEKINVILKNIRLYISEDYSFSNTCDEIRDISYRSLINFNDEFANLLYCNSKEEILNTLKLTKSIRFLVAKNKNNDFCIGLLSNLAKIDYNKPTEIFKLATTIIKEYSTLSYKLAENYVKTFKSAESFKKKIDEIINNPNETKEEIYIRNIVNQKLNYTNGLKDNELIKPFIDKCNSNLKNIIINAFYIKYRSVNKSEETLSKIDVDRYRGAMIDKQEKRRNLRRKAPIAWR